MVVRGKGDKLFDFFIYFILLFVGLVVLFPIMIVLSASVTPYTEIIKNGGLTLLPHGITWDAYEKLFANPRLINGFKVTVLVTVVGTVINMVLTIMTAYPLSRKRLPGRKWLTLLVIFTLMFNGGIIPTYLVVKETHIINTIWAMIIPQAIWTSNLIILKSFFEGLPEELFDAAKIDGAGETRMLLQIVLPLTVPILITIGMYYGVGHWNQFQQAILYITDQDLMPLQVIVRDILNANTQITEADQVVPTMTLQMAAVVTASLPIVLLYPFIQRFYTKGIMAGAVKG